MMPLQIDADDARTDSRRDLWPALLRGLACRCPRCGRGRLFGRYLKVADRCAACGLDLSHQRADDAPPYFTIVLVGHVIVPGALLLEQLSHPPSWLHFAIWLPLTVLLTLLLLPCVKGAVVGAQWSNRMHGFGAYPDPDDRAGA
jgi:uncharacterized protein (DUF983 family)